MMSTLRRLYTLGFLAVAVFGAGRAAEANAIPAGGTIAAIVATLTEGTGVAYDSTNHVYLVVSANNTGASGTVWGRFIAANGTPLGSQFLISAPPTYVHFPNTKFSPDAAGGAGGFIVAWHESDLPGFNTQVHTRMVALGAGGPYGVENVVNSGPTYWNIPIAIAYSTQSREFLLGWERVPGAGGYGISAVRVDNNGAALAAPLAVAVNGQFEQWPSAAYNPVTNQFLVSYAGSVGGGSFVATRLVQSGANQLIGAGPTVLFSSIGTFITATVYNPRTNQFLVAWCWGTTAPTLTSGVLVNANGTVGGPVNLLSNRWASSDGLSVDYNPVTDTYFLVAATSLGGFDGGVELVGSTGTPVDNGFPATTQAGGSGDPYPRIAASPEAPNWLICFSASFMGADAQLVTGTPSGAPPPPPPPGQGSRPIVDVDTPGNGAVQPTSGFVIAGWAADLGATSGTGVDEVVAWAFPTNGAAPILAGIASYGGPRPDVAAALGNANFTNTGYGLIATLPAGSYTLEVSAHSLVNNSWNTPTLRNVTVQSPAPPSHPMMFVDLPGANTIYTQAPGGITVAGWAVDLASPSGPGVDAVHVWAYLQGTSTAIWVGWSPTGGGRPDVGAALGSSQWSTSGFYLKGTLAAGNYTLVVYAHSTVTGTFNDVKTLSLAVR
jgi:hypothetical protein